MCQALATEMKGTSWSSRSPQQRQESGEGDHYILGVGSSSGSMCLGLAGAQRRAISMWGGTEGISGEAFERR